MKLGFVWRRLLGRRPSHDVMVPLRQCLGGAGGDVATHHRGANGPGLPKNYPKENISGEKIYIYCFKSELMITAVNMVY